MDRSRWQKVKSILAKAIEVDPDQRSAFVESSCDGDEAMRLEIEELLRFHEDDHDPLENLSFSPKLAESKSLIGTSMGHYRIIDELGAGGMGTVFLAERSDGEFEQRVAIKIINSSANSSALLRRFRNERQILATLDHPNIAHLIDGGTTADGQPYLVMEYIEGISIIEYANEKNLSIDQRLDLFRNVCSAVSFAHQKLVIHRDLKPSNVFVTNDGTVKLLDFGIAKLLNSESTNETRTQAFAFTPEYASPEQVRGEPLSTSTDIYSLGVILFELLTGSRPFRLDDKNIAEMIRTLTDSTPPTPSAVTDPLRSGVSSTIGQQSTQLKGDLDNIVLMALRKEPERRYLSVDQFSEDIRRHFRGLPVSATKDTWNYRAGKFVQRHRVGVVAAGIVLVTLIAGLVATIYQARIARSERAKAERRFNDVRQLANSFMFEINEQIMSSPIKARELLVERAVEYLDKLSAESSDDPELDGELATAYEKIGDVQSELFKPSSGKTSEALSSHQKSLAIRQKLFEGNPSMATAMAVSDSRMKVGDILVAIGRLAEAKDNYAAGSTVLSSQPAIKDSNFKNQQARLLARLGQAVVRSGSLSEALGYYESSLDIYRTLITENPDNAKFQRNFGIISTYRGFVKLETGKTDEAVQDYGTMLKIERDLMAKDPSDIVSRGYVSGALVWYAVMLSEDGQIPSSIEHFNEGIKMQEAILAADADNLGEEYGLADCRLEFGKAMVKNRLFRESIDPLEKALVGYRKVWDQDKQNLMTKHRIANAQRFLADAYFQTDNKAKAHEIYEQAHAAFKELTVTDTTNVDWQQDLAMTYQRLGEMALIQSNKSAALANFETALPIFEKLSLTSPENIKRRNELEAIRSKIAEAKQ